MSVAAMRWVLENSPTAGADRLLLLIMAEAADDAGRGIALGPKRIAQLARTDERWVRRVRARLVEQGALIPGPIHEKYGTKVYAIAMPTPGELTPRADSPPGRNEQGRGGGSDHRPRADSPPNPTTYPTPEPKDARTRAERRTALEDYDRVAIAS